MSSGKAGRAHAKAAATSDEHPRGKRAAPAKVAKKNQVSVKHAAKRRRGAETTKDIPEEEENAERDESDDNSSDIDSDDLLSPSGSEDEGDKSASEGDEDDDGGEVEDKEILGSFEHYDPSERDFHTLKRFLKDFLDGEEYDSSSLVDLLIEQGPSVGTVQKVGEDEDPFGFVSVVNLHEHQSVKGVSDVCKFIHSKCPAEKKMELAKYVPRSGAAGGNKTGLILSERVINMPDALALPLMTALFDEIKWAVEDQPTEAQRNSFKFTHYILLTKVVKCTAAAFMQTKKAAKQATSKGKGKAPVVEEATTVYVKTEEEAFVKHACLTFDFPITMPQEEGMDVCGRLVVIPAKKAEVVLAGVRDLVGTGAMDAAEA